MANTASHPAPPAAKPATPATPAQPSATAQEDPGAPKKFKRPLPKPGDQDYVVGQPDTEEEAAAIEKEEAEKYAKAKADREAAAKAHEAKK